MGTWTIVFLVGFLVAVGMMIYLRVNDSLDVEDSFICLVLGFIAGLVTLLILTFVFVAIPASSVAVEVETHEVVEAEGGESYENYFMDTNTGEIIRFSEDYVTVPSEGDNQKLRINTSKLKEDSLLRILFGNEDIDVTYVLEEPK